MGFALPILLSSHLSPAIQVRVDARDAARRILHTELTIPVQPGKVALEYPKWIPGEHTPDGPVNGMVNLRFRSGERTLPWARDPYDMNEIDVDVPAGTTSIQAAFDYVSAEGQFTSGNFGTERLMALPWNTVVLYPKGRKSDDLVYQAEVLLPKDWNAESALVSAHDEQLVKYPPVSLTTLVDSPLIAGQYMEVKQVRPGHRIAVVADSEPASKLAPSVLDGAGRMVDEQYALFGARHYRHYTWLVTLSDNTGVFGLEHHESSDDRMGENGPTVAPAWFAMLLAHEYTHSWNGKYRRPAGLATGDYDTPMVGDLLWVYEGLTEHLGWKIPARAGLITPEHYRDNLAYTSAALELGGRSWRPLGDTSRAAALTYFAPNAWRGLRRGTDFYEEGDLLWLEVDAIIRKSSDGKQSLDDFCRAFFGGEGGKAEVKSYELADVVKALQSVTSYDWNSFFDSRINHVMPHPPTGVELSGWKVTFSTEPNTIISEYETRYKQVFLDFSIGATLDQDGKVIDVLSNGAAYRAGVSPGMSVIAVNGRKFSADGIKQAVTDSSHQPIELLIQNFDVFRTVKLDYSGGARYPHLTRDTSKPDLLSEMIKSRSK